MRLIMPRIIKWLCCLWIFWLVTIPLTARCQSLDSGDQTISTGKPKRILVLYSYNYSQPAQQLLAAGLDSARKIANMTPEEYLHEYLDISPPRIPGQRYLLGQLLISKYAGQRFDLIITVFDKALGFLLSEGRNLSPGSPCLALYGQDRPKLEGSGRKVFQYPLHFDVRGTLELALRLFPKTRKVLFVSGKGSLDSIMETRARSDFVPWQGQLELEYTSNRSVDDLLQLAAHLPPETIVFYSHVSSDVTGKVYSPLDVVTRLAKASNAPVFCLATSQLDTGVVGGSMVDVQALGAMLGRILPTLGSKNPLPIEPASHFTRPMVNWQQIVRWDIRPSRLPADTLIINRAPTLWNQYKAAVIATALIFSISLIFIGALVIENRRRAHAERSARLSEARYRVLIDHAPDAIVMYDGDQNRFVDANAQAEKLFGCSRDELCKFDFHRFYPSEQIDGRSVAESVPEHFSQALKGGASQFERTVLSATGAKTLCEVRLVRLPSEKNTLFRASFIDITKRKLDEEALRQSEERFRSILWTAMDGFWLVDKEGRLLQVNDAYCQMSGYSSGELRTLHVSDLEAVDSPTEIAARLDIIAKQGRARFESRHRHKDGHFFDVEISTTYRDSEGGQIVTFIRDITERKRAEQENERLQQQLSQSQRMEYVGRLAGGVAHDFNNMLGVILGYLDIAMIEVGSEQPLFGTLKEIRHAAERSVDLTRQLLAFARKQVVSPKVLDLNATVEGMLKMMRRLIGEDIDLVWHPKAGLWPVVIDPGQVNQILANLCVNARDAIESVGKITIETATATFDEEYCEGRMECVPGDYVVLVVTDDGHGMDKETLDRIFEPFFTTKGVGRGTGLGLSTVYGIVKQNNGFTDVYSEPGKGATFKVYLPCYRGEHETLVKESPASIQTGGTETILLVEDDAAILKMTAMMLERRGYKVLAVSTPSKAIHVSGKYEGEIHLILSDVIMPEMNGRDLVNSITATRRNLKSLFMSGYTADVIAYHGALEEGVNFIHKPFSSKSLAAKVREVLDQK